MAKVAQPIIPLQQKQLVIRKMTLESLGHPRKFLFTLLSNIYFLSITMKRSLTIFLN